MELSNKGLTLKTIKVNSSVYQSDINNPNSKREGSFNLKMKICYRSYKVQRIDKLCVKGIPFSSVQRYSLSYGKP